MRKIFIVFISLLLLWACNYAPDPQLVYRQPTLALLKADTLIYSDTALGASTPFMIKIYANSDTNTYLSEVQIIREFGNSSRVVFDTSLNSKEITLFKTFFSAGSQGLEKWTFRVRDNQEQQVAVSIYISTLNLPLKIDLIRLDGFLYHSVTLEILTQFKIGIVAMASSVNGQENNLNHFWISQQYDTSTIQVLDSMIDCTMLVYSRTFTAPFMIRTDEFKFKVQDSQGQTDSVSLIVFIDNSDLLDELHSGVIWNNIGLNPHGWDLVDNVPRTLQDTELIKDMINTTIPPGDEPYFFENGWYATNKTRFTKANNYNYDSATRSSAADAFTGSTIGTGLTYTYDVDSADIFIVRLRGKNDFIVVRVEKVIKTINDNLDRIEFSYKK